MIVKTIQDIKDTKGDMNTQHWSSLRFFHEEDGMGFTMTDTILKAGMDQTISYKDRLVACYCIEGEGTIEDVETGTAHELKPGTIYVLDKQQGQPYILLS